MLKSLFIASQERCDTTNERCTAWCESRESLQVYYFTVKQKSTVFEAWRLKILRCIVGWRVGGTLICKTVLAFFWWSWKAGLCVKVEISVDAYSKLCARTHSCTQIPCCRWFSYLICTVLLYSSPAVFHLSVRAGETDKHWTTAHPSFSACVVWLCVCRGLNSWDLSIWTVPWWLVSSWDNTNWHLNP